MTVATPSERAGTFGRSNTAHASHIVAVPAVEWQFFLERFARRHRGWLATVYGVEGETPVTRAASVSLESLALERRDADYLVRLTFANHVSLCAPRARALRVQQTDEGAERALEVETADDGFIRLAFRATAMPDQLDGLAPGEITDDRR